MHVGYISEEMKAHRQPFERLLPCHRPGLYTVYSEIEAFGRMINCRGIALYVGRARNVAAQLETDFGRGGTPKSPLRRNLGAVLMTELALRAIAWPVGGLEPRGFTFDAEGEEALTAWMRKNLTVGWYKTGASGDVADALIGAFVPPLNVQGPPGVYNDAAWMVRDGLKAFRWEAGV